MFHRMNKTRMIVVLLLGLLLMPTLSMTIMAQDDTAANQVELIGLIEAFWSAYLSAEYKDVATFTILILVLMFRPSGLLGRPEVRTLASPAAAIALELRAADQCGKKRALLQRAATQGDERSLQQLQALLQTHNCGAYGLADCWSCLRQDDALQRAIAAIEARKPR